MCSKTSSDFIFIASSQMHNTRIIQSWLVDLFSFCFSLSKDLLSQFISILIPGFCLTDGWIKYHTIHFVNLGHCENLLQISKGGRGIITWLKWVEPRPHEIALSHTNKPQEKLSVNLRFTVPISGSKKNAHNSLVCKVSSDN